MTEARIKPIGRIVWITFGLCMIALTGYRAWETYDQGVTSRAFIARVEARDKKNYNDLHATILRWQKVVKRYERDALMKPQGEDVK